MTKKFTAIVTAVIMLVSLVPNFIGTKVYADTAEDALIADLLDDGKIILADFSDLTEEKLAGYIDKKENMEDGDLSINSDSAHTLGNARTSLKWDIEAGQAESVRIKTGYTLAQFDDFDYNIYVNLKSVPTLADGETYSNKTSRIQATLCAKNTSSSTKYASEANNYSLPTADVGVWRSGNSSLSLAGSSTSKQLLNGIASVSQSSDIMVRLLSLAQTTTPCSFYVDSIELRLINHNQTMSDPVPSLSDGTLIKASDFTGTYSLNFEKDIIAAPDAVTVTEDGADITSQVTQSANENGIILTFTNDLNLGVRYMVSVDKNKVRAVTGESIAENVSYRFDTSTIYDFKIKETYPADGASAVDASYNGFESRVTFSGGPTVSDGLENYVTVLQNGASYKDYTLSIEGADIKITFPYGLDGRCQYDITIDSGISDSYGNIEQQGVSYSFTTAKEPIFTGTGSAVDDSNPKNVKILYTSSSDEHIERALANIGGSAVKATDDVDSFYENTLKINYLPTDETEKKSYAVRLIDNSPFQYGNMTTINYLLYQSVPSDKCINLPLYYEGDKGINTQVDANWSGWKVVSFPINTTYDSYHRVVVNINGWSQYRDEPGFICISDVWLSKDAPVAMTVASSSMKNGAVDVKTYGSKLSLDFSQQINSKINPNIKLTTESGSRVLPNDISVNGSNITVDFGELDPSTTFNLSVENVYSTHLYKCDDINISFTTEKYSISSGARDDILDAANSGNVSALSTFIEDNYLYFGFNSGSKTLIDDIASLVADQGNFADFLEVEKCIWNNLQSFNSFNTNFEKWANITELINSNPSFFGGQPDSEYKYYTSLTEGKQNEISIEICKSLPASSVTALNTAFSNAVTAYKNSLNNNTGSNNNTHGGFGGSTSHVSISGGINSSNPVTPVIPAEPVVVFNDIAGYEWAQESIMSLNKAGIISTPDDKKFRPGNNITREEFVKLLVCAFAGEIVDDGYVFADSSVDAWYNEYLSKAYACGISKGYPDGRFGVGEYITREDMVVMAARAIEFVGSNMTTDAPTGFSDESEIASYAIPYITAFVKSGVISGMGDGNFAPKANASRAQAAKVIAQIMKLYK